jgi:hypothetical protein
VPVVVLDVTVVMPPVPPLLEDELVVVPLELLEAFVPVELVADMPPVPLVVVPFPLLPQPTATACTIAAAPANVSHLPRFMRILLLGPVARSRRVPERASRTTITRSKAAHSSRVDVLPYDCKARVRRLAVVTRPTGARCQEPFKA